MALKLASPCSFVLKCLCSLLTGAEKKSGPDQTTVLVLADETVAQHIFYKQTCFPETCLKEKLFKEMGKLFPTVNLGSACIYMFSS